MSSLALFARTNFAYDESTRGELENIKIIIKSKRAGDENKRRNEFFAKRIREKEKKTGGKICSNDVM